MKENTSTEDTSTENTSTSRKVLFVWGGWDGHEPKQCVDLFAPILEREGFTVTISDTLDTYLETDLMHSQDLIVQCVTMSTITPEQEIAMEPS